MRVPFYDIKAQYDELAPQLDQVVHEVLSSGNYIMGPHHNALEKEVAELHGCKHAIGLNSGTDALRIMLDASEIKHGDEVITTAFTFVASIETIVQTGARPVFVDIDPSTFMLDLSKIEAAVTPRTKAIMPVHLFGQLIDVDELGKVSSKLGIQVIEDAAQAIGCHHNGVYAGNFGVSAGLSYYVTKNLGAAGDAGMIITNDDTINERCRSIRIHGMGRERYYYDHVGYTSRLDEIQAAVLRQKLTRLQAWNDARGRWAGIYLSELAGIDDLHLPVTLPGNNHTFHQFTIRSSKRDGLAAFLKQHEIDSMIYYPVPIHYHEPYKQYGAGPGSLPFTEQVSNEVLSLPIHSHLSEEQVRHVAKTVREFFGS